jgi:RNA polymerase sigma-70 factor, ECF subfamily
VRQPEEQDLTVLLQAWSKGDQRALEQLAPRVFKELHRRAVRQMAAERPGHTLQATALINEAYVRLIDWKGVQWQNRAHFFAVCAQFMRRILVDMARAKGGIKRGGGAHETTFDEAVVFRPERSQDLLRLDDALKELEKIDPRKSRIVELRFFGGLSVEETGSVLELSDRTVLREWNLAKAWLYREISGHTPDL